MASENYQNLSSQRTRTRLRVKEFKEMKVDDLVVNPSNWRIHDEAQRNAIRSAFDNVGFAGSIIAYQSERNNNSIVVIDGHMRLDEIDSDTVPVLLLDVNDEEADILLATYDPITSMASTDSEMLKNLLDKIKEDEDAAVRDLLSSVDEDYLSEEIIEPEIENVNTEELEPKLNQAWREFAGEIVDVYDALEPTGYSFSGITKGYAKIKFLNSMYYGKEYPRHCSLAFHRQQFKTNGADFSLYDGLKIVKKNVTRVKAERLRFVSGDEPSMSNIIGGSLPFSGTKMPIDFPASLAKKLINEFAPDGKVLDQCHGWGGRLVGFLLSTAKEYVGIDVSKYQSDGVKSIHQTLTPLVEQEKIVRLRCGEFEDEILDSNFDFAITSPPYFDVEKYLGGNQSHKAKNYKMWHDGFYTNLIEKTYTLLNKNGVFALQIGSQQYNLLEDGIAIAKRVGFTVKETRSTDMTNSFQNTSDEKAEVILILEKS